MREARERAQEPRGAQGSKGSRRSRKSGDSRYEPRLTESSWIRALIAIVIVAAVLYAIQIVDWATDVDLSRYGLRPRSVTGLRGIVISPFVQGSWEHLVSTTLPVMAIGWVVLLSGIRVWALVSVVIIVVGGLLTWLIGPSHTLILGATGVVFGWLGYLMARAYFSRSIKWIIAAAAVLMIFGTLLGGLFPALHSSASWQTHLSGFVAGVGIAALLHPRGTALRQFRRAAVS